MDRQQWYENKANFFNGQALAPWSMEPYGPEEIRKFRYLFDRLGGLAGKHVLEPGCGTGRLTRILAEQVGPKGQVIACDISPVMLAKASDQVQGMPQVRIISSPIETLQVESSSFDLIMCHQVFPHLEDQQACVDRFADLLKPQGQLVIHHLINWHEINDVHRKAGSVVEDDLMPNERELRQIIASSGLVLQWFYDNEWGYGLQAIA